MWFKMCPRCGGDLYLREEIDTREIVCIQCSYIVRQQEELAVRPIRDRVAERSAAERRKVA